jgi:predicted Fe-Mo cluster-binding NifX family protein
MKVAIPTKEGKVNNHFGNSEHYTIYTVLGNKIVAEERISASEECKGKISIAKVLKDKGVSIMLAGDNAGKAVDMENFVGIKIIQGCSGPVPKIAKQFLEGSMSNTASTGNNAARRIN